MVEKSKGSWRGKKISGNGALANPILRHRAGNSHNDTHRRGFRFRISCKPCPDLFANGILIGEEVLRQGLIDDHYPGRVPRVCFGQIAAGKQRNTHGFKIMASYDIGPGAGLIGLCQRMAFEFEGGAHGVAAERQYGHIGGRNNSRQKTQTRIETIHRLAESRIAEPACREC